MALVPDRKHWQLRSQAGDFCVWYAAHMVWIVTDGKAGAEVGRRDSMGLAFSLASARMDARRAEAPKPRAPGQRGQGRKPLGTEPSVRLSGRVTPAQLAKFKRLGGMATLRAFIDRAAEPVAPRSPDSPVKA